jgi:N-acetylmuramic acid 6-phosphate (MurNAc-6-P) etherase
MVNVRPRNLKLRERGIGIIQRVTGVPRPTAETVLLKAGSTAVALVMLRAGVDAPQAERALEASQQIVTSAIKVAAADKRRAAHKAAKRGKSRAS